MFVRSGFPFNYDSDGDSESSGLLCEDATLTLQSQAAECDINTIVRRFGLTGQLPENVRVPEFMDFDGIFDYHSALTIVRQADEAFMEMPAHVRARFHNDAHELVAFCSDVKNRGEAEKLGIVFKKVEAVVPPVVAVVPVVPSAKPV